MWKKSRKVSHFLWIFHTYNKNPQKCGKNPENLHIFLSHCPICGKNELFPVKNKTDSTQFRKISLCVEIIGLPALFTDGNIPSTPVMQRWCRDVLAVCHGATYPQISVYGANIASTNPSLPELCLRDKSQFIEVMTPLQIPVWWEARKTRWKE